jgi:hypothetical protein
MIHGRKQHTGALDVVVVVERRVLDGLPHRLQPSKVDDRMDPVCGESGIERRAVADVRLDAWHGPADDP